MTGLSIECLQTKSRLDSVTGAALNAPLSFPWNLAVSEALLSSINCLSAGGFEERPGFWRNTGWLSLSPTLSVSISPIAQPLQQMISFLSVHATVSRRRPMCVHLCKACDALYCTSRQANILRIALWEAANPWRGEPQRDQKYVQNCGQQHQVEPDWKWVTVLVWNEVDNI